MFALLLIGCDNSIEKLSDENSEGELKASAMAKTMAVQSENAINYEVSDDEFVLRLYSDFEGSEYNSLMQVFSVKDDSTKLFEVAYSFDTSESHWKIKQKEKVLTLAENLQNQSLSLETLVALSDFVDEGIPTAYWDLVEPKDKDITLFSSIYYYESAINTYKRSLEQNTEIDGTIHPSYLLDKMFFEFQEDDIVNIEILKSENFLNGGIYFQGDQDFVDFVESTELQKVPFSVIYSFYTTPTKFNGFLNDLINGQTDGCISANCSIGCGSDLGCCSNYSGCCLVSSKLCLAHDIWCFDCTRILCGPKCQPSGPGTPVVKDLVYHPGV